MLSYNRKLIYFRFLRFLYTNDWKFLYGLLPILRNTYAAFESIDEKIIESTIGMGYNSIQRLTQFELPLAMVLALVVDFTFAKSDNVFIIQKVKRKIKQLSRRNKFEKNNYNFYVSINFYIFTSIMFR